MAQVRSDVRSDTLDGALSLKGLRSALAGPFDIVVDAGCCAAMTGASGSGKSLFLRMIADLDPNEGHVTLGTTNRADISATDWRRRVTYVAAESGWWADRVADHFDPADRPAARDLAGRLDLKTELLDGLVARLSTGEKQRLALIRALVITPAVLLLDEPTSALDEETTARVEALLRERMAAGTTILLVTHNVHQAGRLAERQYHMMSGRMQNA